MAKKILITLGALIVLAVIAGYLFREPLLLAFIRAQIAPDHAFAETRAPAPPDYADPGNWAALPSVEDPSDQLPAGATRDPAGVAVFFVHPTSFLQSTGWNQPLDDETANWIVDQRVLRHQATVFNGCCEIFAPRYRQATFFSFMDDTGSGDQALELAYSDVARAFQTFIARLAPSQPFVLAGHSQGTRHAARLLAQEIAGTQLMARLVAAYLIGFSVTHEQLGNVPPCASGTQTGCAVGWNATDGAAGGVFGETDGLLCTNPLNWRTDATYAAHELNTGAIGYPSYGAALDGEDVTRMDIEVGIADAQCIDGQLAVQELRSESFPSRMGGNSMHIYDYSLFHMNIRENVRTRIDAYLSGVN